MDCSTIDVSVVPVPQEKDILGEVLRQGAQQLLAQAIEAEVTEWIEKHAHLRDDAGHRHVVRNGSLPTRTITTGVGPVEADGRLGTRRPHGDGEPKRPPFEPVREVHRAGDLSASQEEQQYTVGLALMRSSTH